MTVELDKFLKDLQQYRELFAAAFDELHGAVLRQVNVPGQHVSSHHDYPIMSSLQNGFPQFQETGFFSNAPKNYVSAVHPTLAGLLAGLTSPKPALPKQADLSSFLLTHDFGKRLCRNPLVIEDKFSDYKVEHLIRDAVERYLHLYGITSTVDAKRRDAIIRPLISGTVRQNLRVRFVVPIALTHFEVNRFSLTDTAYIARLPKKLQLARARMSTRGSGAVDTVVGAATHAFVSNGWSLDDVDDVDTIRMSLRQTAPNALDAADSFFGALRVATGISTGYAQVLWVPRRWTLDYYCDLTPVYGATLRRYPSEYDNYGWSRPGTTVTVEQLKEVRRIYRAVVDSQSERIRLALNRLNGCLTRDDAHDAILDGTIGLELLLGDDDNQSLSYKLRLRAAALAILHADPAYPAREIADKVKRLYNARSMIVHGRRTKRSKSASEPTDMRHAEERLAASDLLRFALNVLLSHPEYQEPSKIDSGLLLRGDKVGAAAAP